MIEATLAPVVPQIDFVQNLPFILLAVGGLVVLGLDALLDLLVKGMTPARRDKIIANTTLGFLLATVISLFGPISVADWTEGFEVFFAGALRTNLIGGIGAIIILFASIAYTVLAPDFLKRAKVGAGEFFSLVLFATLGMVMLAMSNELVLAFICIEIQSLGLYVLSGIDRRSPKGGEAALKYFLLGAFASAFLVLGIGFLFGATGTTQLFSQKVYSKTATLDVEKANYDMSINEVLAAGERLVTLEAIEPVEGTTTPAGAYEKSTQPVNPRWVYIGFALLLVGLCFKLSLAPFHMWAPDVYEGAPAITGMFIATGSKVAAFAFLVQLMLSMSVWPPFAEASVFLLSLVALLSMVWGNFGALIQTNIKRMLAYSSIAHGGYIAIGITVLAGGSSAEDDIVKAILIYLLSYTIMNIAAFGVAAYLGKEGEGDIANYRGLSKRKPLLAAVMAITMVSLTGIPPTIGFVGKFYIFKEAVQAGLMMLTVIAVLMSAVSAYYYLRVIVAMYMQDEESGAVIAGSGTLARTYAVPVVLGLSVGAIFLFGIFPQLILAFA
ncbi:MAG: NADH-quinone oxidoreductase subunit N [Sumerlaeia bacterium]